MPLKLTARNQALAFALKIAGRFFALDAVWGCFARRLDPAVLPDAQAVVQPSPHWVFAWGIRIPRPLATISGAEPSALCSCRLLRHGQSTCDDSDSPGPMCLSRPPVPARSGLRNPRIAHVMGPPARLTMSADTFILNCPQKPKCKWAAWRQPP